MFLHKNPFIRIILPFIFGIIFELSFQTQNKSLFWIVLLFSSFLIILTISKFVKNFKFRRVYGIIFNMTFILFGIYSVILNTTAIPKINSEQKKNYVATIIEAPKETTKSIKIILEIESEKDSLSWKAINTKAIVYLQKDSASRSLNYGDKIIFNTYLNKVKNSGNPYEFDYKKYLSNKGIHFQTYQKTGTWAKIDENNGDFLKLHANKVRTKLLNIYKFYGFEDQEYAVLSALTLGYRNDLDEETRNAYSSSGAMHILAVSGLHVGIIYLILNFILSFLNKKRFLKILKAIIIIISLWIFAYIAGLSPSVRRSALMFSLIVFGTVLQRTSSIYNSIAVSAFVILLINPYDIMSVGFQLSYSAVLAIIFFQPKIYKLFVNKFWLVDKLWALLTVSIAAQLGTMPLSLFYFHQFPNLFFITNIIVIPLASIILYLASILLAISWFTVVAKIFAFILKYTVVTLNFSTNFIENIPYSTTTGIYISSLQMLLMYIFILLFSVFLLYNKKRILQFSLLTLLMFFTTIFFQNYQKNKQDKFLIYNIRNACAINFINNNNNILFCDTTVINNDKIIEYSIKSNWLHFGYKTGALYNIDTVQNKKDFTQEKISIKNEFLNYKGTRILIIRDKQLLLNKTAKKFELDYIILSNNIYISIDEIFPLFNYKTLIFDSSNKPWRIEKWIDECKELKIDYYCVPNSGAFIENLSN